MQQSGYGASQIHNHHRHQTQHHHLINDGDDGDDDRRCPSRFRITTNSQNNHHLYHHPLQHQMFQPPPPPPSSHLTHQFINPYQTFHQPQQQQQQQLGLEVQDPCPNSHPFYDVNFKLGLEEDSGNNKDEQQQQQQSLIMPPPHCWHSSQKDSSAIKLQQQQQQLFCNVDKEPEMNSDHVIGTKYKRFGGELEEICRITNSGSADVGVDIDRGSEKSLGGEVASLEEKVHENEKKRKRKMKRKLSSMIVFFEGLVKQIMDHQEGLHKKFLEVVQRMDKEKTERDEAWRSEEATKYKRDAIARANEQTMASRREAMIISYIEKITGQSINLPPITKPALSTESEATKEPTKEMKSRWPKAEVEALIQVRGSLDSRFSESGLKGPLWEEVSALMASMGFQRSAKRCKEKWENINKYFRKTKESGKRRSSQSKTCPYFDQLNQFYSRNVISLPSNPDMGFSNEGYPELLQAFVDARDLGKANEMVEFGEGSHGDDKENQEDEGNIDADKNGD